MIDFEEAILFRGFCQYLTFYETFGDKTSKGGELGLCLTTMILDTLRVGYEACITLIPSKVNTFFFVIYVKLRLVEIM
jgi:hypothetical protein